MTVGFARASGQEADGRERCKRRIRTQMIGMIGQRNEQAGSTIGANAVGVQSGRAGICWVS